MGCETAYFQGLSDVICKLGKINGMMLTDKGTTFTDTTFVTEETHHLGIASAITANRNSMVLPLLSFVPTTDEPTINTSQLGFKSIDGRPIPSALAHLNVAACDYQTLQSLEGKLFDIVLFSDENKQVGRRKGINTIKGLRAQIQFVYGLPPENSQESFPVYVFFQDTNEFRNLVFTTPSYSFGDLVDFVPVGLDIRITTAYVAGTFTTVMKLTKRSTGLGYTGLAAADFEILESDADPAPAAVSSIVDNGLGSYDILIKNNTPAALASGEYYRLQASDDDATYVTYLSNVIKETVA